MTRCCVLHVGMHKTGTSSIQRSLFRNPSLRGARYADFGLSNAGVAVQALFSDDPDRHSTLRRRGIDAERVQAERLDREQQFELAFAGPERLVVVSGEGMGTGLNEAALTALRVRLLRHVDEVKVFAYVRDARPFMESSFQTRARLGEGRWNLLALYPRYRERFEKIDRVFGTEHVTLVKFEPAQFPEACVVRDFCRRLDLGLDPKTIVRTNESFSRDAVHLVCCLRRHGDPVPLGPESRRAELLLRRCLAGLQGPKLRFSPWVLAPLFRRRKPDLLWMERRLNAPVSALGSASPDDLEDTDDLMRPHPAAASWLWAQLGETAPASPSPEAVGAAMVRLREKLYNERLAS